MVRAAMSELQLVGLTAEREAEQLVAEADAEDRLLADQLADVRDLRLERLGIARAVGEEDAVGIQREHVLGGRQRRDNRHAAARLHQPAQDVVLDAEIVGDDVVLRRGRASDEFRGRAGLDGLRSSRTAARW